MRKRDNCKLFQVLLQLNAWLYGFFTVCTQFLKIIGIDYIGEIKLILRIGEKMGINIVADSALDYNEGLLPANERGTTIERAPFKISVGGFEWSDFKEDVMGLIEKIRGRGSKVSTACPAPDEFMSQFRTGCDNFVVAMSSKLSGSYNSAVVAKDMFLEKYKNEFVHVFDSKSVSSAQCLIAMKIKEFEKIGMARDIIVEKITQYIDTMATFGIIDSIEALVKNGRISSYMGKVASVLNIVPVLKQKEGLIVQCQKARGKAKAIERVISEIGKKTIDYKNTVLGITHVNAPEFVKEIKAKIEQVYKFKDIVIFNAGGLVTSYAGEGGALISF